MKIQESKKFIQDMEKFKISIDNIANKQKKIYFQKIFDNYLAQVKMIDDNHNPYTNKNINPLEIKENIKELQQIRWQLEQMCKDLNIS